MSANATDLPSGSVVVRGSRVYLKEDVHSDLPWAYIDAGAPWVNFADDDDLDIELTEGAVVLREGFTEAHVVDSPSLD